MNWRGSAEPAATIVRNPGSGALQQIVPSHLMDTQQHDFKNIRATGVLEPDGDMAFDPETFTAVSDLSSVPVTGRFLPASAVIKLVPQR